MAVNENVLAILFFFILWCSVRQVSTVVRHVQNLIHSWFILRLCISCYGLSALPGWLMGVFLDPPSEFLSGAFLGLVDSVPIHSHVGSACAIAFCFWFCILMFGLGPPRSCSAPDYYDKKSQSKGENRSRSEEAARRQKKNKKSPDCKEKEADRRNWPPARHGEAVGQLHGGPRTLPSLIWATGQ
jgi:hypothetical protein